MVEIETPERKKLLSEILSKFLLIGWARKIDKGYVMKVLWKKVFKWN